MVIFPFEPPKQLTLFAIKLCIVGPLKSLTTIEAVAVHKLTSVTVTV